MIKQSLLLTDQFDRGRLPQNNIFHAHQGCKNECGRWHTRKYIGAHISRYFEIGWVACGICEIVFEPNPQTIKNKKFCKCCGKTIRRRMRQPNNKNDSNHRE